MENEELFTLLAQKNPLNLASYEKLKTWTNRNYYEKNQIILSPGDIPSCVWYIERGSATGYYFEGNNKITTFHRHEGSLLLSGNGFLSTDPSKIYIKMMERSIMRAIPFDHLTGLKDQYPGTDQCLRKLLAEHNQVLKIENVEEVTFQKQEPAETPSQAMPKETMMTANKTMSLYLGMSLQTFIRSRGLDKS